MYGSLDAHALKRLEARKRKQGLMFLIFRGAALLNGIALAFICGFLLIKGVPALSWEFISEMPRDSMTAGGIWPAIAGTAILAIGALAIAKV